MQAGTDIKHVANYPFNTWRFGAFSCITEGMNRLVDARASDQAPDSISCAYWVSVSSSEAAVGLLPSVCHHSSQVWIKWLSGRAADKE